MAKIPRAEQEEDTVDMTAEVDVFLPPPKFVTTVDGETISIGKVTWGMQLRIARALGLVLAELPSGIGTVDGEGNLQVGELSEVLPVLFNKAPAAMTAICVAVLDKDAEWVEANLELDSVWEIVVPFSKQILGKMGGLANVDLLQGPPTQ